MTSSFLIWKHILSRTVAEMYDINGLENFHVDHGLEYLLDEV